MKGGGLHSVHSEGKVWFSIEAKIKSVKTSHPAKDGANKRRQNLGGEERPERTSTNHKKERYWLP